MATMEQIKELHELANKCEDLKHKIFKYWSPTHPEPFHSAMIEMIKAAKTTYTTARQEYCDSRIKAAEEDARMAAEEEIDRALGIYQEPPLAEEDE